MDPHVAPGDNSAVQMRDILNVVAEWDQEGPGDVSDVLVHIDRCASAREVPEHLAGLQTARQHDLSRTETAVTRDVDDEDVVRATSERQHLFHKDNRSHLDDVEPAVSGDGHRTRDAV